MEEPTDPPPRLDFRDAFTWAISRQLAYVIYAAVLVGALWIIRIIM